MPNPTHCTWRGQKFKSKQAMIFAAVKAHPNLNYVQYAEMTGRPKRQVAATLHVLSKKEMIRKDKSSTPYTYAPANAKFVPTGFLSLLNDEIISTQKKIDNLSKHLADLHTTRKVCQTLTTR